jgi:hypothetical protein
MSAPRRRVRIELLLGAVVVDEQGRRLGRIEEFRARRRGDDWEVVEYELGSAGLIERLAASDMVSWLWRALDIRLSEPRRIPSEALDLSDPRRPVHRPAWSRHADAARETGSSRVREG